METRLPHLLIYILLSQASIIACTNVEKPYDAGASVAVVQFEQASNGRTLTVYGDGRTELSTSGNTEIRSRLSDAQMADLIGMATFEFWNAPEYCVWCTPMQGASPPNCRELLFCRPYMRPPSLRIQLRERSRTVFADENDTTGRIAEKVLQAANCDWNSCK